MQAVADGRDPNGFYLSQEEVAPTFANDYVAPAADMAGDPDDQVAQREFADQLAERYFRTPPMTRYAAAS